MTEKTFVEEIEKAMEKSKGLDINELLFSYQGISYPVTVCSSETFQALENFEARKDDMVLVSYPKCVDLKGIAKSRPNHHCWQLLLLAGMNLTAAFCKPVKRNDPWLRALMNSSKISGVGHGSGQNTERLLIFATEAEISKILESISSDGINWLILIVNDLIATTLKTKQENTELPFIECGDPEKYQRMKQFPSPRIVATHLHYNYFPKSILKNKAKILVLFRNPKDTATSYFQFHNNAPSVPSYNSWEEFFSSFMNGQVAWGSYFDHAVAWNKHIDEENVLILTYEALKEDLVAGVKQIAEFFGFTATAEQIQSIADRATFQAVRDRSQETHGAAGPLLFRKGMVGDWKNLFDEVQNQKMDAKFKECLAGTKLGAKLKYDVYCKA